MAEHGKGLANVYGDLVKVTGMLLILDSLKDVQAC